MFQTDKPELKLGRTEMVIPYEKVLRCKRKEGNGFVPNNKPMKM